jgi:RNA polymerase sigma-70 factor (ECF subfamily)
MTNDIANGRTSDRSASFPFPVRQYTEEELMDRSPTPSLAGLDGLDVSWADTLDRLRAFVATRVGDREVAADITQDVIVRSIASGALERVENPVAWLYRSARNAVIDHHRTRHPHEPIVDHDRWPDPEIVGDAPNDATRELSRCLRPLLEQLAPTARDALVRVDIEGHTHRDAADTLGLSVSGMKSRVQRARREIKELLERCCAFELDNLGAVADYKPNSDTCGCATTPTGCQSPTTPTPV